MGGDSLGLGHTRLAMVDVGKLSRDRSPSDTDRQRPRRLCRRAGTTTRRPRARGLSTSPGFGKRDARCGDPGSERDADGGEVDQRLALGGGVARNARLPEAAGSGRQRRRASRLVQLELKRDFPKRLLEVSLHLTPVTLTDGSDRGLSFAPTLAAMPQTN